MTTIRTLIAIERALKEHLPSGKRGRQIRFPSEELRALALAAHDGLGDARRAVETAHEAVYALLERSAEEVAIERRRRVALKEEATRGK